MFYGRKLAKIEKKFGLVIETETEWRFGRTLVIFGNLHIHYTGLSINIILEIDWFASILFDMLKSKRQKVNFQRVILQI